jgi:hypothetical protein
MVTLMAGASSPSPKENSSPTHPSSENEQAAAAERGKTLFHGLNLGGNSVSGHSSHAFKLFNPRTRSISGAVNWHCCSPACRSTAAVRASSLCPIPLPGPGEWFDTSAYCGVGTAGCPAGGGPSGLDGLVRVNSLDGPGYKNVDASIFRDFAINERVRFQFRGEATNVFNHVNLNNPGGTLSSTSSFGVISGALPMRVLQIGARLLF